MKKYEIMKNVHTVEEGYLALAQTLVEMAQKELKTALITGDERKTKMCEAWFRSGWFQVLTLGNVDPDFIIEQTRKEVRHGHKGMARTIPKST